MLCPMKFNASTLHHTKGSYDAYFGERCQCEEEKCAWWVENIAITSLGADKKTEDIGCCAIKLSGIRPPRYYFPLKEDG